MPHKRETQMVCNLHFPTGTRYLRFFRIWNRRAFQERKPYQFPGWMKNSPCYFPGRGANPRPPSHPDFMRSKESHTLLVRPKGGSLLKHLNAQLAIASRVIFMRSWVRVQVGGQILYHTSSTVGNTIFLAFIEPFISDCY